MRIRLMFGLLLLAIHSFAQNDTYSSKFKQLIEEFPTPNVYRTASGAPGPAYWQQRADYDMKIELDDEKQALKGSETITFYNNSPDELTYLWIQLDQNGFDKESITNQTDQTKMADVMDFNQVKKLIWNYDFGFKIGKVKDASGKDLTYTINKTMMRIELPKPLKAKSTFKFSIDWNYNITDQPMFGGRSGYEYFPKDSNYIYEIAQFFPRLCVYTDYTGWQNKQFIGDAEFTLCFGNYKVDITVPADHVVSATGTLQNAKSILTATQLERLDKAKKSFDKPVVIITQEEATKNEPSRAKTKKTWSFVAENVRDFAWASSRKFIWDAMNVKIGKNEVMAMSLYPKEANPLWGKYATFSIYQSLTTYSRFSVDYTYPVCIAIHGPVFGMEYPMISFNGCRPDKDGSYTQRLKESLISVIIHEVGHNFFPMIINSDERQWAWMDEGVNSFVEYLAEQEWSRDYNSRRGPAKSIVNYMKGDKANQNPIMTNPESIIQMGNVTYGKTAAALNILRETVLGRELFDYAFKEYCRRWAYKHPTPYDFFRTMEDASATDLDWFWKAWFFTNDNVDLAIENVTAYVIDTKNPEVEGPKQKSDADAKPKDISMIRNRTSISKTTVERYDHLRDRYDSVNAYEVTQSKKDLFENYIKVLSPDEKEILMAGNYFYEVNIKNVGGMISPVILELVFEDGTTEVKRIPAELWRKNDKAATKIFVTTKSVKQVNLDPFLETADIDTKNNTFTPKSVTQRFPVFKK